MKTLRLILLGGLLLDVALLSSAQAQVYGARRMVNRRLPQAQAPLNPAATNTVTSATNSPAASALPPAPPTLRTQAIVRFIQPPIDPEKAKAAKAEALRKTIEFQKKRAEEGSESAQYELGMRYLKGDGVEKDEALGRKMLVTSSQNGFGPAARKLEELDKPPKPKEE